MGFVLWIQSFDNAGARGVSESFMQEALGGRITKESDDTWSVEYDDLNSVTIFMDRRPDGVITSFSVERPCVDDRLWTALYDLIREGRWVLYGPEVGPFVADPSAARNLPQEMIEALGEPKFVTDGSAIKRGIVSHEA